VKVWASNLQRPQILASAFWNLKLYDITADLLHVLDAMAALTLAIQHLLSRAPGCLTPGQIADEDRGDQAVAAATVTGRASKPSM